MQIRVERVIMEENLKQFKLVCMSSLFNSDIILKIEKFGDTDMGKNLMFHRQLIVDLDSKLSLFL